MGRAQDIIDAMTGESADLAPPAPQEAVVRDFAALAALYDLARRLHLVEHIDRHVPKRGRGPSVGTYLLVAALNRCVASCSKAQIGRWLEGTVLRRWLDLEPRQLSSQRFWENMDRVSRQAIAAIERDLTTHCVREVALLFPPPPRQRIPVLKTTLSTMSDEQHTLYEALDLDRYRGP